MTTSRKNVTVDRRDPGASAWEGVLGGLCVLLFIVTWLLSLFSPLLFVYAVTYRHHVVAASIVAITVIAYLPWDRGSISRRLQAFIDTHHPSYYESMKFVFEGGEVPPAQHRQTFFAVHPHGAFCIGWAQLFTSPQMHGVRFCFAPALYASPFFRLFSRSVGKPGSAARGSMNAYLSAGEDCALPPGGFEEATLTSTTKDRVFIKRRYGFVRLCLKHGVAIRPVYVFGEGRLFGNIQGLWKLRLALNRVGLPTIFVWGRWCLPLMPRKGVGLHIVVGRTIAVPRIEDPSREEVDVWHKKYIAELRRIYEEHKEEAYGSEAGKEAKLEVW